MRRNSPLSQYHRGAVFFDTRVFHGDKALEARTVANLRAMLAFDSLSFGPLLSLADQVYKETPLEDKLSGLMNRFENDNKLYTGKKGLGGVEVTGDAALVAVK
jgi:hypothetical protein